MDIAVGGLTWLGNFLNHSPGSITLKQQEESLLRVDCSDDEVEYNIIINPKFSEGARGWYGQGCSLFVGDADDRSSNYCVAYGRSEKSHGLAQEIGKRLDAGVSYKVEAWVGIRASGRAAAWQKVAVVHATVKLVKADGGEERISLCRVEVKKGQWCLLTGTLQESDQPRDATIYIDGPDGEIDILVSSVAIVPTSTTGVRIVEIENQIDQGQVLDSRLCKEVAVNRPTLKDDYFEVNIVINSDFANGLDYWYPMGDCTLSVEDGGPTIVGDTVKNSLFHSDEPILSGKYIQCSNRTETFMGPCQDITDQVQLLATYQLFCWCSTTMPFGTVAVDVSIDVDGQWVQGGEALVGLDWVQIQGSFRLESEFKMVQVYLQGPLAGVDIKLAGLQIFSVDRLARTLVLQKRTEKLRKRDVIVKLRDSQGNLLPEGTKVNIQQQSNSFPMGTCINYDSLADPWYTSFFLKHFNFAVFENELKWDQIEPEEGEERFYKADEMVKFCNDNNIPMRGHCIVWDVNQEVPDWVQALDGMALLAAVEDRITELMTRYKGQFVHYDVNNEMLHGDFYEQKLGEEFLPYLFKVCHGLDPGPKLFVNEFDVENNYDCSTTPQRYADMIKFLLDHGAPVGAIGIQGHLTVPIGPILEACLDILSSLELPIWFTEIDVTSIDEFKRADDLEVVLREAFAHPAVHGCLLWGFMEGAMSRVNACLVETDRTINGAGQRLIDLREEWTTTFEGFTDGNGEIVFRGYHGNYTFTVSGEEVGQRAINTFDVVEGDGFLELDIPN